MENRKTGVLKQFKTYRNRLNKEIGEARIKYFSQTFNEISHDTAATWKKINSVFCRAKTPNTVTEVVIEGKTIAKTDLAEAFNDYLVSLSFSPVTGDISRYMKNPCPDTIFLRAVTEAEVYTTIMQLKNSSCTDSFGIQIRPVKFVADIIACPLSHIFNICLSAGSFPIALKTAKVTVIYKKGDKNNLEN